MDSEVRLGFRLTRLLQVWVLLIGQICLVAGQDLCSIYNHRSAIIQNTLYFFGGNYTFSDSPASPQSTLFSINLEVGLDISGPIASGRLGQSSLPTDQLNNVADGAELFYDSTGFYAYVASPQESTNNDVWFYNVSSNTSDAWSLQRVGGDSSIPDDLLAGQAASSADGRSFYLGGDVGPDHEGGPIGLTIFDSRDPDSLDWNFDVGTVTQRPPGIQSGELVYLRKGQAGVLLAFGGVNTTFPQTSETFLREFNTISIYDIASQTWYSQDATGVDGLIPDVLRDFCAGVSAAPDDSSFQITMYGGISPQTRNSSNAIWILSIPSFEWVFGGTTGTGEPDGDNGYTGRERPKCDMLNDRQMIVSGGKVLDNRENQDDDTLPGWSNQECDPGLPPIKLLDTTDIAWRTQIDSVTPYSVPSIVFDRIGGDGSGGATMTGPQNGWSDSRLEGIFSQTVPRESQTSSEPTQSTDAEVTSTPRPVGAIAGGIVGGLAFLVLLCVGAFFLWRRRKRRTATDFPGGAELPESRAQNGVLLDSNSRAELHDSQKRAEMHASGEVVEIGGSKRHRSFRAELPT